jgi:hypothetical protein
MKSVAFRTYVGDKCINGLAETDTVLYAVFPDRSRKRSELCGSDNQRSFYNWSIPIPMNLKRDDIVEIWEETNCNLHNDTLICKLKVRGRKPI